TRFSRDWSSDVCSSDLRPLGQRDAGQQAAVGAAIDAEPGGRGDAALDQVFRDREQVFIGALAVFEQGGLMPGRAIFTAAAQVGEIGRASCRVRVSSPGG